MKPSECACALFQPMQEVGPGIGRELLHPDPQQLPASGLSSGRQDAARSEALSHKDKVANSASLAV